MPRIIASCLLISTLVVGHAVGDEPSSAIALCIDLGADHPSARPAGIHSPAHADGSLIDAHDRWTSTGSSDVEAGVVAADGTPLDGVVIDMGMPGSDGNRVNYNADWHQAIGPRADQGVYGLDPCRFHVRRNGRFGGLAVRGLPAGLYDVYAIRPAGTSKEVYQVRVGIDMNRFTEGEPASMKHVEPGEGWNRGHDYTRSRIEIRQGHSIGIFVAPVSTGDAEARLAAVQIVPVSTH